MADGGGEVYLPITQPLRGQLLRHYYLLDEIRKLDTEIDWMRSRIASVEARIDTSGVRRPYAEQMLAAMRADVDSDISKQVTLRQALPPSYQQIRVRISNSTWANGQQPYLVHCRTLEDVQALGLLAAFMGALDLPRPRMVINLDNRPRQRVLDVMRHEARFLNLEIIEANLGADA